jgi:hypothetical protein
MPSYALEWKDQPVITTCLGKDNTKTKVCFGDTIDGNRVLCLGTASDECPSADDCSKEFKAKTDAKEWVSTSLSGNNKPNPAGGSSIPATKSCKLKPVKEIEASHAANKLVKVECGSSPMFIKAVNEDKGVTKELVPTTLKIDGKIIDLEKFKSKGIPNGFYWLWTALSKQSMDNEMENPDIRTQKAAGESKILQELKDQGVDLKKINSNNSPIEFTYTPPSKDHLDQAPFYYQSAKYQQIVVCEGNPDGYGSFFNAYPEEVSIKECNEAIILGTSVNELGMRSSTYGTTACFAKKDELYCADANVCIKDGYSKTPLEFRKPATRTQPGTKDANTTSPQ